jgi:hypothetical protein
MQFMYWSFEAFPCGSFHWFLLLDIEKLLRHSLLDEMLSSCRGKIVSVLKQLSTAPLRRMRVSDPDVFHLDTSWRWVVSFMPLPHYRRVNEPVTHCVGSCVDPRGDLDDMEKGKFSITQGLALPSPCFPARSQSLCQLRYRGSVFYFTMSISLILQTFTHCLVWNVFKSEIIHSFLCFSCLKTI